MTNVKIRQVGRTELHHRVVRSVQYKVLNPDGTLKDTDLSYRVIDDMLAYPEIPIREEWAGFSYAPFFTPSGRLVLKPGWDPETKRYLVLPESLQGVSVPLEPNDEDVQQSVELLLDILVDFPFATDADRANAIAKMLDPFTRTIHGNLTPLYVVEATAAGTGKGLLIDVLTLIATGEPALRTPLPKSDSELAKKLLSFVVAGTDHIHFDNFEGTLNSTTLAIFLTSARYADRILGQSEAPDFHPRMNLSLSGNNVVLGGDMGRRVVLIRLDANIEHPELRTRFQHLDIRAYVLKNRAAIVTAILTIVQAWLNNGSQGGSVTLGGFEDWAKMTSGILEYAGLTGLDENRKMVQERSDVEAVSKEALVSAWFEARGSTPTRATDLLPVVEALEFPPVTVCENDRGTVSAIGKWLHHHKGTVIAGFKIDIDHVDRSNGSTYYRLTNASPLKHLG